MADIFEISEIIDAMVDGFEDAVIGCLADNTDKAVLAVQEQLWSGQDGEGQMLSPTYDSDPYFEQEGMWYHRAKDYQAWKYSITPPSSGYMLGLPPRPANVPNLFINGKFYSQIFAQMQGDVLRVAEGSDYNAPEIVGKYGSQILRLGPMSIKYFNEELLTPRIWNFFEECGW